MTSSLFSQLSLGARAMQVQQAGMQTAGHNIANAEDEDYSRQRVEYAARHPTRTLLGGGVDVERVARVRDNFVNKRLISEQSADGGFAVREQGLRALEGLFAEIEGHGLRDSLNQFWGAWAGLANNPEQEIHRHDVLQKGEALAARMNDLHDSIETLRGDFNERIRQSIHEVNQKAKTIANLNRQISRVDRMRGEANDLRDAREKALKELSTIVEVKWVEDSKHRIDVTIGNGFALVSGEKNGQLRLAPAEFSSAASMQIQGFQPSGPPHNLTQSLKNGELHHLVELRDNTAAKALGGINTLADTLMYEVNRLHNPGSGLLNSFNTLQGATEVGNLWQNQPAPFLREGMFRVQFTTPDGEEITDTLEVPVYAGQDSVEDVVARIHQLGNGRISADITPQGSVRLEAALGEHFILGPDDSDFSVTLGLNGFFHSGGGAKGFSINPELSENPQRITTGQRLKPGDNTTALSIHQLQFSPVFNQKTTTLDEYYNGTLIDLGLEIDRVQQEAENHSLIVDQFQKLRNEVSG